LLVTGRWRQVQDPNSLSKHTPSYSSDFAIKIKIWVQVADCSRVSTIQMVSGRTFDVLGYGLKCASFAVGLFGKEIKRVADGRYFHGQ